MFKEEVHIGSEIRKVFLTRKKEEGMTVGHFAKKLGCNRTHVYSIFKSKSINTDVLIMMSEILKYNFLSEYFRVGAPSTAYLVLAQGDVSKMEKLKANLSLKIVSDSSCA